MSAYANHLRRPNSPSWPTGFRSHLPRLVEYAGFRNGLIDSFKCKISHFSIDAARPFRQTAPLIKLRNIIHSHHIIQLWTCLNYEFTRKLINVWAAKVGKLNFDYGKLRRLRFRGRGNDWPFRKSIGFPGEFCATANICVRFRFRNPRRFSSDWKVTMRRSFW